MYEERFRLFDCFVLFVCLIVFDCFDFNYDYDSDDGGQREDGK